MGETREGRVLAYAPSRMPQVEVLKKSLRRMLLLGGGLVLLSGAALFALGSDDVTSLWMEGLAIGSGVISMWLRRAVRKGNRVGILCGACLAWTVAAGFAGFVIGWLIYVTQHSPSVQVTFLLWGVLGSLCFTMDLGLIGVAWGLGKLWRELGRERLMG